MSDLKIYWDFVDISPNNFPDKVNRGLALDTRGKAAFESSENVVEFSHHHSGSEDVKSSAGLLFSKIDSEDNEITKLKDDNTPLVIFCHRQPDFDCCVSSYLAWAYLTSTTWEKDGFKEYAEKLADTTDLIDSGALMPLDLDKKDSYLNLYTIFLMLDEYLYSVQFGNKIERPGYLDDIAELVGEIFPECMFHWKKMDEIKMAVSMLIFHGLFILDSEGSFLNRVRVGEDKGKEHLNSIKDLIDRLSHKFHKAPAWKNIFKVFVKNNEPLNNKNPLPIENISSDENQQKAFALLLSGITDVIAEKIPLVTERIAQEKELVETNEKKLLNIKLYDPEDPDNPKKVKGISIAVSDEYAGIIAKLVRNMKFGNDTVTVVAITVKHEEDDRRAIISVHPSTENKDALKGLGLALQKENIMRGCPKGDPKGIRFFDHEDPWFDGRGGHLFTIVDAPAKPQYRCLKFEQIINVLTSDWYKLAKDYNSDEDDVKKYINL